MKKIGILTYLKEYANHGTNMQSYSTLRAVQKAHPGDRVELIDYSGWKPLMKPYLSQLSLESLQKDYIRIRKYQKFFKESLVLSKKQLISADLEKSIAFIRAQQYDAIYVGADTLLELKRAGKDELTAYWLDPSIKCKKYLLAASSHNVVYENLSEVQKQKMQETIDDFSLLGVRDEPTFRLISRFTKPGDPRLQLIPDPTFTFDIDYAPAEAYMRRRKLQPGKPIVCLHLTRDTAFAQDLATAFRKAGYLVASFRPAYYADLLLSDLSAAEQAGIYRYFELVITHRFHDSIFAIKNLIPVMFFPEHSEDVTRFRESKTLTLFKSFGLESTGYLADKERLTAQGLFDRHRDAITCFRQQEAQIRSVLQSHKKCYESFLAESKTLHNTTPVCQL